MKTVRVVAAVIKAINADGEPIVLQRREVMEISKVDGNSLVER